MKRVVNVIHGHLFSFSHGHLELPYRGWANVITYELGKPVDIRAVPIATETREAFLLVIEHLNDLPESNDAGLVRDFSENRYLSPASDPPAPPVSLWGRLKARLTRP